MSALAFAERAVEHVAAQLEELLPSGPKPRQLAVKGFLVSLFLTKDDDRPLFLLRATDVLAKLSTADKRRLGVPEKVTYRHVERLFTALADLMEPNPVRTRRAKHHDPLTAEEQARRQALQDEVNDRLLEATIPEKHKDHGSYALDWTDVDAWARPPGRTRPSADPSAAWGHRRAKSPHPGGNSDESFYGWLEQVITMVNEEGKAKVPELVRRQTLTAANVPQPPVSLAMLARYRTDDGNAGDLLADSAYPYADKWTTSVTALGFSPVVDLHPNLLGRKGTEQGAIVVDDLLLCPMTPEALIDPPRPADNASEDEWDTYFEQRAERDKYAFAHHGRADDEGDQRVKCPAECGKVRCPLKPASMSNSIASPKIFNPPAPAPCCCTQRTMTITRALAGKVRQKHPYYSPEWQPRTSGGPQLNAVSAPRRTSPASTSPAAASE